MLEFKQLADMNMAVETFLEKPTLTRTWLSSNKIWHTSITIKSNNMLVGQWHARVQTISRRMTVETFPNKTGSLHFLSEQGKP